MTALSKFFTLAFGIFITSALLMMYSSLVPVSHSQTNTIEATKTTQPQKGGSSVSGAETPVSKNEEPPFSYDPIGKRDPFQPYLKSGLGLTTPVIPAVELPKAEAPPSNEPPPGRAALQEQPRSNDPLVKYELAKYKVVGIIWDVSTPRAVIRSPENKLFTVNKNAKLGNNNGRVTDIKEGEIVVVEKNDGQRAAPNMVILTLEQGMSE
jgi:hypothetical protein